MINKLYVFFVLGLLFIPFRGNTQKKISEEDYSYLKVNNLLDQSVHYEIDLSNSTQPESLSIQSLSLTSTSASTSSGGCGCYIEPDTSYILAMQPNDDGSSSIINLPFSFCFYGTQQDSLYINNNGNISFGDPYTTFSGVAFPDTFQMVAPFWGDVDTSPPSSGVSGGQVLYKITPTALIINWVDVGYYNAKVDKRNTFQLIITDGNDPLIANGNNVAFCYKDMQWTTGEASGGTNGFGGTPATVGANKGDSIDYIQFGRFDHAGVDYDGPVNNADGVSWLDNQSFFFNACSNSNIPPIATGVEFCDTIRMCKGDTTSFNLSFLSPEVTQVTNAQILSAPPGFTTVTNSSGVNADIEAYLIGSPANAGYNTLTFMAYDNGTPVDTIYSSVVVFVDTTEIFPAILGDTITCKGDSVNLTLNDNYDAYQWNTSNFTSKDIRVPAGNYVVKVTKGYCSKSTAQFSVSNVNVSPTITGNLSFCDGGSTNLSGGPNGMNTYTWSTGDNTQNTTVDTSGWVSLTIEEPILGCKESDSVNVTILPLPKPVITAPDTFYCHDDSININISNFPYIRWSNGETNVRSIRVGAGIHTVTVRDGNNCQNSTSYRIYKIKPDTNITIADTLICVNRKTDIRANSKNVAFNWNTGKDTRIISVGPGTYKVTVTDKWGCTDSASAKVYPAPDPISRFSIDPPIKGLINSPIQFSDGSSVVEGDIIDYDWQFVEYGLESEERNPNLEFETIGKTEVILTVTTDQGCRHSYTLPYELVKDVFVPNVITPNGDGVNDYLVFPLIELLPGSTLTIFNRWGEVIYKSDNYQNNWDGHDLNSGTYFFVLDHHTNIVPVKKGTVTITK